MGLVIFFIMFIVVAYFVIKILSQDEPESPTKPASQAPKVQVKFEDQDHDFVHWTQRNDLLWTGKRKLQLKYKDRSGVITNRRIQILSIWPGETGEIYFRAFCELRDDWRTFKASNVLQIQNARNKIFEDFSEYMAKELKI